MITLNWWKRLVAWVKGDPAPQRMDDVEDLLRTQIIDLRRAMRK